MKELTGAPNIQDVLSKGNGTTENMYKIFHHTLTNHNEIWSNEDHKLIASL